MLGGIAPLLIITLKKAPGPEDPLLPFLRQEIGGETVDLAVIPLYLSRELSGLIVESESKTIDIRTDTDTQVTDNPPEAMQRGVNSVISISILATKDAPGINVLMALSDKMFEWVTNPTRPYSVTWLNGAFTLFEGLFDSFTVNQSTEDPSVYKITLQLSNASAGKKKKKEGKPGLGKVATGGSL